MRGAASDLLFEGAAEGGERVEAGFFSDFLDGKGGFVEEELAGLFYAEVVKVVVEGGVEYLVEILGHVGAVGAEGSGEFLQGEGWI